MLSHKSANSWTRQQITEINKRFTNSIYIIFFQKILVLNFSLKYGYGTNNIELNEISTTKFIYFFNSQIYSGILTAYVNANQIV